MIHILNRIILVTLSVSLLVGCSSNSTTPQSNSGTSTSYPAVTISQMSTMPMIANSGQSFSLAVRNSTGSNIHLKTSTLNKNSADVPARNLTNDIIIDTAACTTLAKGAVCTVTVSPQSHSGRAEVQLAFIDDKNSSKIYTGRQLISWGEVPAISGFMVNNNNLFAVASPGTLFDFAIPFVLSEDFLPQSIKVNSSITPVSE